MRCPRGKTRRRLLSAWWPAGLSSAVPRSPSPASAGGSARRDGASSGTTRCPGRCSCRARPSPPPGRARRFQARAVSLPTAANPDRPIRVTGFATRISDADDGPDRFRAVCAVCPQEQCEVDFVGDPADLHPDVITETGPVDTSVYLCPATTAGSRPPTAVASAAPPRAASTASGAPTSPRRASSSARSKRTSCSSSDRGFHGSGGNRSPSPADSTTETNPMSGSKKDIASTLIHWAKGLDPAPCFARYGFVYEQQRHSVAVANEDGKNLLAKLLGRLDAVWKKNYPEVVNPSPATALFGMARGGLTAHDFRDRSQIWLGGDRRHLAAAEDSDNSAKTGWTWVAPANWQYRSEPFRKISGQGPTSLETACEIYDKALGDFMMGVFAAPTQRSTESSYADTINEIVVLEVGWENNVQPIKRHQIWCSAISEIVFL